MLLFLLHFLTTFPLDFYNRMSPDSLPVSDPELVEAGLFFGPRYHELYMCFGGKGTYLGTNWVFGRDLKAPLNGALELLSAVPGLNGVLASCLCDRVGDTGWLLGIGLSKLLPNWLSDLGADHLLAGCIGFACIGATTLGSDLNSPTGVFKLLLASLSLASIFCCRSDERGTTLSALF